MKKPNDFEIEKMKRMKRNGATCREIAEKTGWANTTVSNYTSEVTKKWKDPNWLRTQREKGLTQEEMTEGLPVGQATISKWENKHGVKKPWRDPDVLHKLYIEQKMSTPEIASRYGLGSHTTIADNLREAGIEVREPLWITRNVENPGDGEGSELYYGPNWEEKRKEALEHHGKVCKIEGCDVVKPLDVHHIEPLRSFDSFEKAHDKNNLIPLCKKHHGKIEIGLLNCPSAEGI